MKINVLQISGIHMQSNLESGHRIDMDGAKEIGGQDHGARPMELFLSALAGCSGIDVLLIMKKARCEFKKFEIEVIGTRRDAIPRVFTSIHLIFKIKAKGITTEQLERAVALSVDKYCSVRSMIRDEVKITYQLEHENWL